jgi:hypothetical protein
MVDELVEAGRVLEGGETCRRVPRPARGAAEAARGGDRAGRADDPAEGERA